MLLSPAGQEEGQRELEEASNLLILLFRPNTKQAKPTTEGQRPRYTTYRESDAGNKVAGHLEGETGTASFKTQR